MNRYSMPQHRLSLVSGQVVQASSCLLHDYCAAVIHPPTLYLTGAVRPVVQASYDGVDDG
jgi:hypothetical protein